MGIWRSEKSMNKTQGIIKQLKKNGWTKWQIKKACNVAWNTVHMWDKGLYEPGDLSSSILEDMLTEKP